MRVSSSTFPHLALIDFAFSLVSRERLAISLPLGWQKDYDYQSPRLLRALEAGRDGDLVPTQELDWRCDLYSLAAMLRRFLPDEQRDWTIAQRDDARAFVFALREAHDRDDADAAAAPRPARAVGGPCARCDARAFDRRGLDARPRRAPGRRGGLGQRR
jgi:hypothetical protein